MDEVKVDDQPDPSFISEEGYFTHSLEVARDLSMISLAEKKNKRESFISTQSYPRHKTRVVQLGPFLSDPDRDDERSRTSAGRLLLTLAHQSKSED